MIIIYKRQMNVIIIIDVNNKHYHQYHRYKQRINIIIDMNNENWHL